MTSQRFTVGISDWKLCHSPDVLVTYALGSCVGICLYDSGKKLAGLSHIMLPDSTQIRGEINRMKFADTAIPDMYHELINKGAVHSHLSAKIAGGALMFAAVGDRFNIGERNVEAVKKQLAALKIPIIAEDTGLNFGRTVFFYAENGNVEIKSTTQGLKRI